MTQHQALMVAALFIVGALFSFVMGFFCGKAWREFRG